MYSYVICMSLVCTRVPSICHSQYVTRMYSYVICMLLVCTRMSSVCYSYALACQLASFFFFCRTFPEYWRIRSPPQGLRVYLRVPPYGLTLGSHIRVPPQGPTLGSWVLLFRYAFHIIRLLKSVISLKCFTSFNSSNILLSCVCTHLYINGLHINLHINLQD